MGHNSAGAATRELGRGTQNLALFPIAAHESVTLSKGKGDLPSEEREATRNTFCSIKKSSISS